MGKAAILSLVLFFVCFAAFGQKGNNQIGIGLNMGLPIGALGESTNLGIGRTSNGMYGIGTAGQLKLTNGYVSFSAKEYCFSIKSSTGIIPIFAGYRHHIIQFYLESQLGPSIIGSNASVDMEGMGSFNSTSSATGFGWAMDVGYLLDGFEFCFAISHLHEMLRA